MGQKRTDSETESDDAHSQEDVSQRKERLVWGSLSAEEIKRPGAVLTALVFEVANNRNLTPNAVLDELGISYSYYMGLRNGTKEFRNIGEETLERFAKFLRLPKVSVKLAAGQLRLEDFYQDESKVDSYLLPTLKFMQRDPEYGHLMPLSILTLDRDVQLFVIALYERATGRTIIPTKVSVDEVTERFKRLLDSQN